MSKERDAIINGPLGRNVLKFGMPLAIAMGLQACFNLADLFIIAKLPNGGEAIGALAICDMIAVVGTILVTGVSNASVAVISRFFGREDRVSLSHASWNSVHIVIVFSLIFGGIGIFAADFIIIDLMGTTGEVGPIAVSYLQILVGNSWTIFFLLHLTAVMRALGSAKWPAIILIGANVLNVLLDIFMVYGPGPTPEIFAWERAISTALGIPRMGINGAAWATVIARGAGVLACIAVLARFKWRPRLRWQEVRPTRRELWRLTRIGAPSSAQFLVRITAVLVCLAIVNRLFTTADDTTVLTAFGICIRLDMLALFMGLGWGSAAATFVGINMGGRKLERARRSGWWAAGYNFVAMAILAVLYLVFSRSLISVFSTDPAVIQVGQEYLYIVGGTYAFIGLAVVLSNALQGATDTVSSFLIDAIVIVGVQLPLLFVFVAVLDLPRTWIWYNIAGANVLSAIAYAVWYQRGGWMRREL